jgi:putative peptidoglycan lipid II flippase
MSKTPPSLSPEIQPDTSRRSSPFSRFGGKSPASDGQQVVRNAFVIGVLLLAAKFFAALREVVIAWRYGVSGIADAFNIAFTVVTWAPQLLVSIMIISLVPHLVASSTTPGYRRLVSEMNAAALGGALAIFLATLIAGPWIATEIAGGLGAATVEASGEMTLIMAPFALFLVLCGYFGVRLQARQRFSYTFLEAMPPLLLSAFVIGLGSAGNYRALAFGILTGGLVQFALLLRLVHRDEGIGMPRLKFTDPAWRGIYLAVGMIALGQTLNALSIPIDQIIAAKLGTGAVATIGYSNRLMGLITSLAIAVIGYSLLPVLSATAARGQFGTGRASALQAAKFLFFGGAVVAAAAWIFGGWGVALIFKRGAFTAEDADAVSTVFKLATLQIPFFASGLALMQWLAATKQHGRICVVLLAMACVKLVSALILSKLWGLSGIALSQVVMYCILYLGMLAFVLVDRRENVLHDIAGNAADDDRLKNDPQGSNLL